MRKIILGLVAAAAIATPLAVAGSASAAPAPKTTGDLAWVAGDYAGTVVFNANAKTGGTLHYQDNHERWITGVVTPGSVVKTGNTATFEGTITDGSNNYAGLHNAIGTFTVQVIDGGEGSNAPADKIIVFIDEVAYNIPTDSWAAVTGGNLQVH